MLPGESIIRSLKRNTNGEFQMNTISTVLGETMFEINQAIRAGASGMVSIAKEREIGMAWENEIMSCACWHPYDQAFRDLIRAHVNHEDSRTIHQLVYIM